MTQIAPQPTTSRQKFHSLKVDMTPMVDLGFLLITFFIFTATLSQPGVTRLIMPKEGPETSVAQRNALTFLLDKNKVYAYEGLWNEAKAKQAITALDYSLQNGLGSSIRQKQKTLQQKDDLVVLIKPLPASSYQNIIAALDDMQINGVKKYALLDAAPEEKQYIQMK
jgi:biopolymer transport protein ExbD